MPCCFLEILVYLGGCFLCSTLYINITSVIFINMVGDNSIILNLALHRSRSRRQNCGAKIISVYTRYFTLFMHAIFSIVL